MIWEPFVLALVLGIIVSAGLYFAYLWPSVEPVEPLPDAADRPAAGPADGSTDDVVAPAQATTDDAASPP